MDNQYTYINQIKKMDYWTLVNMLLLQITPDVRKCILDRLVEINNQQLINMNILTNTQIDNTKYNIPKKNSDFMNENKITHQKLNKEINLDEIIDGIENIQDDLGKKDELDRKLERIKYLKQKIIDRKNAKKR